tara:strand:- start:32 stop:343 length:312 start_codon:yes stop_codon:yes gene_type:complete
MISKAQAILSIKSDAQISTDQDNKVIWHDGNPSNITDKQIEDKQAELLVEYNNNKYQRDRKKEYPSILEFIEAYTEKEIGGNSTKWDAYKTAYNKVRTDNPKE